MHRFPNDLRFSRDTGTRTRTGIRYTEWASCIRPASGIHNLYSESIQHNNTDREFLTRIIIIPQLPPRSNVGCIYGIYIYCIDCLYIGTVYILTVVLHERVIDEDGHCRMPAPPPPWMEQYRGCRCCCCCDGPAGNDHHTTATTTTTTVGGDGVK